MSMTGMHLADAVHCLLSHMLHIIKLHHQLISCLNSDLVNRQLSISKPSLEHFFLGRVQLLFI